jgi:hypothetical protein
VKRAEIRITWRNGATEACRRVRCDARNAWFHAARRFDGRPAYQAASVSKNRARPHLAAANSC